jgi:CRP-like cAMP-binding protein
MEHAMATLGSCPHARLERDRDGQKLFEAGECDGKCFVVKTGKVAIVIEAQMCLGSDVVVGGGGNSAGHAAVFLAGKDRKVYDETDRRMMELRLQGYSPAEIAAELRLHPIAARVRMSRLRQRLRTAGLLDEWL